MERGLGLGEITLPRFIKFIVKLFYYQADVRMLLNSAFRPIMNIYSWTSFSTMVTFEKV